MIGTTAALIAGGLGAAGSIGGAAIGANAAGNAADAQSAAGARAATDIDAATIAAQQSGVRGIEHGLIELDTGLARASGIQQDILNTSRGYVAPYQQAGQGAITQLGDLTAPGGEFNRQPTMADLELDPGFAFRMQEGQKALEKSAAARGTSLSGGALKELERYSQGVASDEYGKAFERFRTGQNDRFGRLSTLSGFGQDANAQAIAAGTNYGNQVGGYEMNTAGTKANIATQGNQWIGSTGLQGTIAAGNARTGAANAQAAGQVGAANAWSNAVGNIGSSAADLYLISLLGNRRTTQPATPPPVAPVKPY